MARTKKAPENIWTYNARDNCRQPMTFGAPSPISTSVPEDPWTALWFCLGLSLLPTYRSLEPRVKMARSAKLEDEPSFALSVRGDRATFQAAVAGPQLQNYALTVEMETSQEPNSNPQHHYFAMALEELLVLYRECPEAVVGRAAACAQHNDRIAFRRLAHHYRVTGVREYTVLAHTPQEAARVAHILGEARFCMSPLEIVVAPYADRTYAVTPSGLDAQELPSYFTVVEVPILL